MPDLISQMYVKLDGQNVPETFMHSLVSIVVENDLDQPDMAIVRLHDMEHHWVDQIKIGTAIEISAQGKPGDPLLFDGEVVGIEPTYESSESHVSVRAFDRLHRLARGRQSRTYINSTDQDIFAVVARDAGLQVQMDAAIPTQTYNHVYQHNQTNLEFLRLRAARMGGAIHVSGKTLHCMARQVGAPVAKLQMHGADAATDQAVTLSSFSPRLSSAELVDEVTVRGWNSETKQEIIGKALRRANQPPGYKGEGFGKVNTFTVDYPIFSQAEADAIAKAKIDEIMRGYITGEGTCAGSAAIRAGKTVEIVAVGETFAGKYYVTGTYHRFGFDKGGYSTTFKFSKATDANLHTMLAPERGSQPRMGLMVGIVTDNQDPEGQGRVKVKLPTLSADHATAWARVAAPGGGQERGVTFLPEVNDEMVVGFEHGNIERPFVLGGLWNGEDAPPKKSSELINSGRVEKRMIRSRTGHTITLDDSDGGGGITIEDAKGNKIHLDTSSNALTIEVKGSASVKAQGNLSLEAGGNVSMKAGGQVEIKGVVINLN